MFGIGSKLKTPEIAAPTTEEVTAETPASSKTKETQQTASSSREILNALSKPTEESNLALPQTTEPLSGISLKEAPKSLQKALNFLPEKARQELTVFKVDENKYQISFGPDFFPHGLKGLMLALNPLKSHHIPSEAKELLKQSERANDLMPLLRQGKLHMQTLFEANEKTAKLTDLTISDSPHGLLEDIINGKNPAMKKLLTEILDQILPEANVKKKKDKTAKINLSEGDKPAFLALKEALKEKKSEAALTKAQPIIDSIARTYGLETLKNTDEIRLDKALEISINTLINKNRAKEGGNTTIFVKGHSSEEFPAPKLEINGFIPGKNEFKPGIMTVINDNDSPKTNLPLATLLTTLEMAHFANGGKLEKKLEPELIKAVLANTNNAAEIAANSQAKAAVAEMN